MSTVSTASSSKPPLPPGWKKCPSRSHPGHFYYFNVNTAARTWERPVLAEETHSPDPEETEQKPTGRKNHDSGVYSDSPTGAGPPDREDRLPANDAASCVSMRSASEKVSHYFNSMLDEKAGPSSVRSPSEAPSERGQKRKIEDDLYSDDQSMISLSAFSLSSSKAFSLSSSKALSLLSAKDTVEPRASEKWRRFPSPPQNGVKDTQVGETAAEATTSSSQSTQAERDSKTITAGKRILAQLSSKNLKPLRTPKPSTVSRPPRSPNQQPLSTNAEGNSTQTRAQKEGDTNNNGVPLDNGLDPLPDYDEVEGYAAPAPSKAKHKRMKAGLPPYDLRHKITGEVTETVPGNYNERQKRRSPSSFLRKKQLEQRKKDLRDKLMTKSMPPPGPPAEAAGTGAVEDSGQFARPLAPGQAAVFKAPFPVPRRQPRPYHGGQPWRDANHNKNQHYNKPQHYNKQQNYMTLAQMPVSLQITMANRTDNNWTDSLTVCESPKFRSGEMDKMICMLDQRDQRKVALQGDTNAALGNNTTPTQDDFNHAASQENLDDSVEMDIDMDVETEERLISEIQQVRGHLSTDAMPTRGTLTSLKVVQTEYMETETTGVSTVDGNLPLFIVLDTNVLLNHLKFLDDLKDQQISGMGRPVLVVPWVVMQELDALKSQALLQKPGRTLKLETQHQAAQAVRYLYKCLQNRHPRVRGQTAQEGTVKLVGFNPECNDDRVLQCCLMYSQKFTGVNVILFTNDKNLCNKAVINGMQAFTRETLMAGIKAMYPGEGLASPTAVPSRNPMALPVKQESPDQIRSPCMTPPLPGAPPMRATTPPMPPPRQTHQRTGTDTTSRRKQMADDVLCGLKTVLKSILAVVLETEMKAAYEDNWKMIVYRKPPWSLQDLLLCFDKHWIAVFGMFLSRDVQAHLDSLVSHFTRGPSYGVDLQETAQLLQDALQLLRQLHNHHTYGGNLPKAISDLQLAHQQCNSVLNGDISCLMPKGTPSPTPGALHTTQQEESTSVPLTDPVQRMWITFDVVWKAVNYFLIKIFDALDYKHSIPRGDEDGPLPSRYDAVTFMTVLHPHLQRVIQDVDSFLKLERAEQLQPLATSLCNSLHAFLDELVFKDTTTDSLRYTMGILLKESVGLTPDVLIRHGRNPDAQEKMNRGLQQLDTYLSQLMQCAHFILPEAQKNNWVQTSDR